MKESAPNTYQFRLGRAAYIRTGLMALLLLSSFLLCGLVMINVTCSTCCANGGMARSASGIHA